MTREDWHAKRRAVDAVMNDIGGVVIRVGDETVSEMWSLYDGRDVLNEVDPQFAKNIETHIQRALRDDPFHVSANTDPKGDRSKRPQDQDPDMLLHVVKETDKGIVVRGAKYETAAAYANQAFVKPTIANWGDDKLSDYAVGFICDMGSPGHAMFAEPEAGKWLAKSYSVNENWKAEDRRRLLAFARDLTNSDYAGHRITFELFAQSPPFAHLGAVFRNFDWTKPLAFVKKAAGLSDRVMK